MPDKKTCEICIICNKPKDSNKETYYCGKDSKKLHYYHAMCLEKLKLLLKIRESNALNSVDFKSLEIVLGVLIDEIPGVLIDDIPNEMISTLNQGLSEKQPKFEIALDLDKKPEPNCNDCKFYVDFICTYLSECKHNEKFKPKEADSKLPEYNRLRQCEKCLFEYTKHLVCYKGGYQSIDQKEPCLLFKPKKENNCKIESELGLDKKKHNFFSRGWYEEIENPCELCTENPEENRFCLDCEYHPSNIIKRINLLLSNDSKTVEEIAIISKAFNLTTKNFLKFIIKKEIDYVKFLFGLSNPKSELESYYEFEINIDELKRLILIEEVL